MIIVLCILGSLALLISALAILGVATYDRERSEGKR
jgi:hypothetical protein